ncbi:hypothetical protein Tco_0919202, partial [Tanacetum coccineum]
STCTTVLTPARTSKGFKSVAVQMESMPWILAWNYNGCLLESQLSHATDSTKADRLKSLTSPSGKVTHPDANMAFDLRPTDDVLPWPGDDTALAKAILMANLSSYGLEVIFKANILKNESLTDELQRYKEHVRMFEKRQNVDLSSREKFIESQMDDLIREKNAKVASFEKEIDTLK